MQTQFSIRQVADMFGVVKSTMIAWEDKGHVPKPNRDPGGNRTYKKEDIIEIAGYLNKRQRRKALAALERRIKRENNKLGFLKELSEALSANES